LTMAIICPSSVTNSPIEKHHQAAPSRRNTTPPAPAPPNPRILGFHPWAWCGGEEKGPRWRLKGGERCPRPSPPPWSNKATKGFPRSQTNPTNPRQNCHLDSTERSEPKRGRGPAFRAGEEDRWHHPPTMIRSCQHLAAHATKTTGQHPQMSPAACRLRLSIQGRHPDVRIPWPHRPDSQGEADVAGHAWTTFSHEKGMDLLAGCTVPPNISVYFVDLANRREKERVGWGASDQTRADRCRWATSLLSPGLGRSKVTLTGSTLLDFQSAGLDLLQEVHGLPPSWKTAEIGQSSAAGIRGRARLPRLLGRTEGSTPTVKQRARGGDLAAPSSTASRACPSDILGGDKGREE
jgi:hypothetical protein